MSELVERFRRLLRDAPDRPLIHHASAGVSWTTAAVAAGARTLEAWLATVDVGADDLVLLATGNRPVTFAAWLACRGRGAAILPVDAGATPVEMRALAVRFGATLALLPPGDAAAAEVGNVLPAPPQVLAVRPAGAVRAPQICRGAAVLKLTSGSTGLPKATFTTDAELVLDTEHIVDAMDIASDAVQMAAIPLSHAYGIGNLLVPALTRGTAVVLREGFVPHQMPADARRFGARVFPGVPFMFDHFVSSPPEGGWPRSLCRLVSAGARLDAVTVRRFAEAFGVKIHSFYGTTETGGIAFDDSETLWDVPPVGRPMSDVAITLRPEDGAPDGGGRVHVSGPTVACGYAGEPTSDGAFVDGGYLTGDVGRFDEDGRLYLTGRVSMFINVAGRKVQPDEVEQVLRELPQIADVRVVAAADPKRGEQIVACVVSRDGWSDLLMLRRYCAGRLAPHKIPRAVVWLDALPMTSRGKTDRARLAAIVGERLAESGML
jgi:acyl-coenzyme A synthetase/AMP-(fatty) acid ligase